MNTLAVLIVLGGAAAVIPPPVMSPKAATNLYPNGTVNAASVPRLLWKQGGIFATQQQPPPARYFRVCIYDTTAGQSCNEPGFGQIYAAGSPVLHQTPVTSPLRTQVVTGTYRYSFEVPANLLQPDWSYRWSVGACKTSDAGSCVYPPHPALLRLSTRNLTVTGIEETIRTGYVGMTTEVANTGATDTEPFSVFSEIVPAALDEDTQTCATRIADSETAYRAYTAAGEVVSVLPSDDVPVVGIPVPTFTAQTTDPPQGLSTGSAVQRAPLEVYLTQDTPLPAAFLLLTKADSLGDVAEYDESDNGRAECHVVYP